MKRVFVQTRIFSRQLDSKGSPSILETIEDEILKNVEVGKVIRGLGGIRKFRIADERRQKGKRGGLRVLYLDLSAREQTYLLYLYGKDESEDINTEERRQVLELVRVIKGT